MKVLFVALTFVPDRKSPNPGVNRYWCELSKALAAKGVEIEVVTPLRSGLPQTEVWRGIKILRIPDTKTLFGRAGVIGDLNALSFSLNLARHRKLAESADVVQTDMPLPTLPKGRGFPPRVSVVHHPYRVWTGLDLLWTPFGTLYQRRSLETSACIVVPSQAVAEELAESHGLDRTSIRVVHHGIDTQLFAPAEQNMGPHDDSGLRIAYVGLLEERKGVFDLADALGRLRSSGIDATLTLVSSGPESGGFRQYCQERELLKNIEFVEKATDEDLVRILRGCDVFLFPSRQEGFGFAMAEAMACGKPVVAYDTPVAREVVGECGVLVPQWHQDALATALSELATNTERRQQIGRAARARIIRMFNWSQAASEYSTIYDALRE